jgi:hypothetical protein
MSTSNILVRNLVIALADKRLQLHYVKQHSHASLQDYQHYFMVFYNSGTNTEVYIWQQNLQLTDSTEKPQKYKCQEIMYDWHHGTSYALTSRLVSNSQSFMN